MTGRALLNQAAALGLSFCAEALADLIDQRDDYIQRVDAKGQRYLNALARLPGTEPSSLDLDADWVRIGEAADLAASQRAALLAVLEDYRPWRKGPFRLFGIDLDSEWVSFLKWNRVKDRIASLADRRVLDIGSSCGYYLFRMAAAKPALALGLEPYLTYYFQYRLLQHYAKVPGLFCLPVKFEELPPMPGYFDTVFSMGVLYHRRSPVDTLVGMRKVLRRGGELVLETLIIDGEGDLALCPAERYAKMNNVYFLPTVPCLSNWLRRAGFDHIRCLDVTRTTGAEQRRTGWVQTESLSDFLHPSDPTRTVEGYPAPLRAIFLAQVG